MECAINELSLLLGRVTERRELHEQAKDFASVLFPECVAAELVITSKSKPGINCPMEVLLRELRQPNDDEILIQPLSLSHGEHLMEVLDKNEENIDNSKRQVILFNLESCALARLKRIQFILVTDGLPRSAIQKAGILKKQLSVALDRAYHLEQVASVGNDLNASSATSPHRTYMCCSKGCLSRNQDRTNSRKCSVAFAESLCNAEIGEYPIHVMTRLYEELDAETGFLLMEIPGSCEFVCHCVGRKILEDPIAVNLNDKLIKTVLKTKNSLIQMSLTETQLRPILPILQAELQNSELLVSTGDTEKPVVKESKVDSLIAVPLACPKTTIMRGIVCIVNKRKKPFTKIDERIIQDYMLHAFPLLRCSLAYHNERLHKKRSEVMLKVAKNLFTHMMDLTNLLLKIMQEARNLTKAERCSVFLLDQDSKMLVAKVLDGLPTAPNKNTKFVTPTGETVVLPEEIRISLNQGVAGYVAKTGEILNIKDAYSNPLFYRGVDQETGFHTKNILCFPIKNELDGVIGVAQLCNKIGFPHFTQLDEEAAKTLSVYCCISLVHSLMYKEVQEAQNRTRLATEMMTYHMQVKQETFRWLSTCDIPPLDDLIPNSATFHSIPRDIKSDDNTYRALMYMFESLDLLTRWRLSRKTLARFILMVRRGYREPAYHNWMHGFTVCHFAYVCLKTLQLHATHLKDMEIFALIVATLCHDVDHRGTNNSFQTQSKSILAALYSSEGSVLERHHFSQTVCILNTEGCNIFESLSQKDYAKMLDLIRGMILATDLAHHLNRVPKLRELTKEGYSRCRKDHHQLLCSLIMTASDLSDQTKDWRNATFVANLIYEEFFQQGDLERALGHDPVASMDRERACVPELQISFLDVVILPLYDIFVKIFPQADEITARLKNHRARWGILLDRVERGQISANGPQIFKHDLNDEGLFLSNA